MSAPDGRGTSGAPAGLTDGERWTRREMRGLRAARFTPGAWGRFIAASVVRSAQDARTRPHLTREALVWSGAGMCLWLAAMALDVRAAVGAAWWIFACAMLLTHIGMVEGPGGEPRTSLGPATALTLARAWVVPALPLVSGEPAAFLALFLGAGVADIVDGPLARRGDHVTRLGVHADAASDLAFLLTAAWTAVAAGWLPAWAAAILSVRYVGLAAALAALAFARCSTPGRADVLSGRTAGLTAAAAVALAAMEATRPVAPWLLAAAVAAGLVPAVLSLRALARRG